MDYYACIISKTHSYSHSLWSGAQVKERYEQLDRETGYDWGGTSPQKRVLKDVVDCENSILAVCEGRFPK